MVVVVIDGNVADVAVVGNHAEYAVKGKWLLSCSWATLARWWSRAMSWSRAVLARSWSRGMIPRTRNQNPAI